MSDAPASAVDAPALGRGFGKVILLGEHSVVYGYRALAAALPGAVELAASAAPSGSGVTVSVPQWELELAAAAEPAHPVARALAAMVAELVERGARRAALADVRLAGHAAIWPGAGLGSSAAFEVAAVRALAARAGLALDDAAVRAVADVGERVFHGQPSGLDVALATSGGAGVFCRERGLVCVALPPLTLVVGHSGAPRSTAAMVARVAERTGGDRNDPRLRALGELAERGIAACARDDVPALGAAMDRAQALLAELGVSTEAIDELCVAARGAGAWGVKLTGAGGGGSVVALTSAHGAGAVEAAWAVLGRKTLRVTLAATQP